MKQWYVLHSRPNAEYQLTTALWERGIQTYLPEIEVRKTKGGRKRKPFFPCYLFAKINFEEISFSQIQWTPGLRRIVAFDGQPVPLDDEVIALIQRKLEEGNLTDGQVPHPFQSGDTVRITEGPLQGLQAIFEGPTTAAERVQVLLTFLGQVSRAQVPVTALEKTDPDAAPSPPKRPRRTRGRGRRINSSA